ncbi:MAG: substrate-binding domain-containing protein [Chloroflexota bacterium]
MKEKALFNWSNKRMGKRVTVYLLIIIGTFILAACNGSEQAASVPENSADVAAQDSAEIPDGFVTEAKARVEQATEPAEVWDGPTSGPVAQTNKLIVYVASDLRNGGVLGVSEGVQEAGDAIGWEIRILDGRGTESGRQIALEEALSLNPDGIVIGGFDANEHKALMDQANAAGIVMVGWHVAADPGPVANSPVFANISSDSKDVAEIAALFAVSDSNGKGGVVIFTDSNFEVALAKSDFMKEIIEACKSCQLLSVEDVSLADTSLQMPDRITDLYNQFGNDWDYSLGINDLYFDFGAPSIQLAFGSADNGPKSLSAGDGSISAYQRIRTQEGQVGTVPEPLKLHGWQVVDELNRAFAGEEWSGYVTPVHLVINENIGFDGGPSNVYDPENGYQEAYQKIWRGEVVSRSN